MSACFTNTAVAGCYDNGTTQQPVVIHYTYDNQGAPAVRITTVDGVVISGANPTNTTVGDCPCAALSVRGLTTSW